MRKMGDVIGVISLVWILCFGGAEFNSFWLHILFAAIGLGGLFLAGFLLSSARRKKRVNWHEVTDNHRKVLKRGVQGLRIK